MFRVHAALKSLLATCGLVATFAGALAPVAFAGRHAAAAATVQDAREDRGEEPGVRARPTVSAAGRMEAEASRIPRSDSNGSWVCPPRIVASALVPDAGERRAQLRSWAWTVLNHRPSAWVGRLHLRP